MQPAEGVPLPGGRMTSGLVRHGDRVRRPTGPWSPAVHEYLRHLASAGFEGSPRVLATGDGWEELTYFEGGGLELYVQKDTGRYEQTAKAVKWLSDNSFLWTTKGRGASPRKSIIDRPDYKTAGAPWDVRGAFVEGMSFATVGEIPVAAGPEFTVYSGGNFLAKTLETVWAKQKTPEVAMQQLKAQWQKGLDAG